MYTNVVKKYLLLLVTLWPALYFLYTEVFIYDKMVQALAIVVAPNQADTNLQVIYYLHIATVIILVATFTFYTLHLYSNRRIPGDRKMIWVLGFIVLTIAAFVFYWWKYLTPAGPRLQEDAAKGNHL